jgi:hypothetical protein
MLATAMHNQFKSFFPANQLLKAAGPRCFLIPKKDLEPRRRQLGVAHRVLDQLVADIGLDRTGIDAVVGQLEPTGTLRRRATR